MAKRVSSRKSSKPAPKPAKRTTMVMMGKKTARPLSQRKLGTGGTDPPTGGNN